MIAASRFPAFCALVLAALLAACAPRLAVQGVENRLPGIEGEGLDARYVTRDGLRLGLNIWSAQNPSAVIVALHGMNDYARAFSRPAPYWASRGVTTYAYDQRGHGRSPSPGMWAGGDAMRRDLADFVDIVRARHPGLPVVVMGESMGGAVALTAFASENPPAADGLILIAPAVWGWTVLPFTHRATLWLGAHVVPWMDLSGSGLGIVPTDNVEVLRENARDPLFQKRARIDAVFGVVDLMDDAYEAVEKVRVPVLFMYGDKDQVIPRDPTRQAATRLSSASVKEYRGGYHMLLRDLAARPRWDDVLAWIGRLPSRYRESVSK